MKTLLAYIFSRKAKTENLVNNLCSNEKQSRYRLDFLSIRVIICLGVMRYAYTV